MKTIYLAGPITGEPNWKEVFGKAAQDLASIDYIILNPAEIAKLVDTQLVLPTYRDYFSTGLLMMVKNADAICMLPNWESSPGARAEHEVARALNMEIFYGVAQVP